MNKFFVISMIIKLSLFADTLSLDDAIQIGLKNNRNLKISSIAVKIANAQYEQALSQNYPKITGSMGFKRVSEDSYLAIKGNFDLPQNLTNALALSSAMVSDTLQNTTTQLPTTYSNVQGGLIPKQSIPLNMNVKTLGRDTSLGRIDLFYPIYTGGKIDALIEQAKLNKSVQSEELRRNEAQVLYDIKRFYYGIMLSEKIYAQYEQDLQKMKVILDLTEMFYKSGLFGLKKTDYLNIKGIVNVLEAFNEEMATNVELSKSALVNVVGLPWNTQLQIPKCEFEKPVLNTQITSLIQDAQLFNPMVSQLKLAVKINDAKISQLEADNLPQVVLTADAQHIDNTYSQGFINDSNRNTWSIGVALQWNLFEGNRNSYAIQEEKLNRENTRNKEILLQEGLALMVKNLFLKLSQSQHQDKSLNEAQLLSSENADLTIDAYREGAIGMKDVIEAHLFNTMTNISYYKNLYDFSLYQAEMDYIIVSSIKGK